MKGDIKRLAQKLNAYAENIGGNIDRALVPAEHLFLDINRKQMKDEQKDNKDQSLPEYSSYWKAIKGLTYFNLYDKGSFQNNMIMSIKYPLYSINSTDRKTPLIIARVGSDRFFGIPTSKQKKAQRISNYVIGKDIKQKCFKNK